MIGATPTSAKRATGNASFGSLLCLARLSTAKRKGDNRWWEPQDEWQCDVAKKRTARITVICAFGTVFALWGAHAAMVTDGNVTWPHFCEVEQVAKYENLDGIKFEVTDTDFDLLTKDEFVTVFASDASVKGRWFFYDWRSRRIPVLRYDRGRFDEPWPLIKRSSAGTILISVPKVSSIGLQVRKWGRQSIDYEIGRVDYR